MLRLRHLTVSALALLFLIAGVAADPTNPKPDDAIADAAGRFDRLPRPDVPAPQHPEKSTPDNVDTKRPIQDWQSATDDWFGARPWLDDRGLTFQADLTLDWSRNLRGGANTEGWAFRHLFNASLTLDTERLFQWPGGTLFIAFQNQHGENGANDAGDLQGFDNIDADGRTQLSELWYEQKLLDGLLRLKVGKIDANSDFACPHNGGEFINSSFGVSPTILALPSYPDPAMGVQLFAHPAEWCYLGFGVFDGAGHEGVPTGSRGPKTFFGPPADLFFIGEAGVTWTLGSAELPGRFAAGAWGHTGTFARFAGSAQRGTEGFYLIGEQTLWRENPASKDDAQGLAGFIQYGFADADVSSVQHHVGAGVTWTGALPTRDDDVLGLGVSWVRLSDQAGAGFGDDTETTVELFYKVQLLPWLSVKPDLQYIHNPGGLAAQDDAVVATLRVRIDF